MLWMNFRIVSLLNIKWVQKQHILIKIYIQTFYLIHY